MPGPNALMPHSGPYRKRSSSQWKRALRTAGPMAVTTLALAIAIFSLPAILSLDIKSERSVARQPFPVSVDPAKKLIVENPAADGLILQNANGQLSAAAGEIRAVVSSVASFIASLPFYQLLAGADERFVTIQPGYREEEVAQSFAKELDWSAKERATFLTSLRTTPPTLSEGEFVPGTYEVHAAASPSEVQNLLNDRFTSDILDRYSTTTSQQVPLNDALTIASLIERETGGADDMRLISGVIWNRLFHNMNLQIDATLQYAKASTAKSWWPAVKPADKYIKSPYNTYAHAGLPPAPIASPSVAAVIAALNPKPTDCLFYFHDKYGNFHCSATYEEHVALLKQYYGRGK